MAELTNSSEIKGVERQELTRPEHKPYSEIKSEQHHSLSDLNQFWHEEFGNMRKESNADGVKPVDIYGWSEDDIPIDFEVDGSLRKSLESFQNDSWNELSEAEKLEAIRDLGQAIDQKLELKDAPEIVLVDGPQTDYGGYVEPENQIEINRNHLDDPKELVDTIAHETRHAYQHERADILQTPEDRLYRENMDAYITPIKLPFGGYLLYEDYANQYVEADARAFANTITGAME